MDEVPVSEPTRDNVWAPEFGTTGDWHLAAEIVMGRQTEAIGQQVQLNEKLIEVNGSLLARIRSLERGQTVLAVIVAVQAVLMVVGSLR